MQNHRKRSLTDALDRTCIDTEPKLMALLSYHPNIVQIHDLVDTDSTLSIYKELVDPSVSIYDRLVSSGTFSESQTASFAKQILQGLSHCHRYGVVHRDIKPENILSDLRNDAVKICDFGSGAWLGEGETIEGVKIGKKDEPRGRKGLARQETRTSIPRPRLSMDCLSEAKSTTSEEEDDVRAVSRDETGLILSLVSLRFLDVRIHLKDATENPESRRRRSRGSGRERCGFAPVFLREGDQKVDDFTRLRSTIAVVAEEDDEG
ncbi:hypothetical protein F2Q68_00030754 [Brassica cretica]|uniref:Protein kinase domain-containing protein n=1 Tax=Brassica cretica TaxID=69181 RepID=A0A8S9GH79_BRACR|nr:hypothetical protein F2Q68_00030754 [Brassica cretica]